jgi:hypothetical protein
MRYGLSLLLSFLLVLGSHAQAGKRLWVLEAPDHVVEYDLGAFAAVARVTVPKRLLEHPEYLSVNARGQLLFQLPRDVEIAGGDTAAGGHRAWLWDGRQSREFPLGDRQVFLTADGQSLVWFENRFAIVAGADGLDRSVRTSARVWRTDLVGTADQTLVAIPVSAPCQCTTGTCSESCPEWSMWAPDGAVADFFVMTRFIPGQLQTSYEQTVTYRQSGRQWRPDSLAAPVEAVLAASRQGDVIVAVAQDGGCCGWLNEGNDQTFVLDHGRRATVFDETARFNNRNYDVSFYTTDARIGPGNGLVAHTINTDVPLGDDLRLSADGKADAAELARVRAALADVPITEVVLPGSRPKVVASIRHAAVVGWLNDRELLVAQDGRLVIYDAGGTKIKETPIRIRSGADAFLR